MGRPAFKIARSIINSRNLQRSLPYSTAIRSSLVMNSSETNPATSSSSDAANIDPTTNKSSQELPKLSAKEFTTYNHMAEQMQLYHNHFRHEWNRLYSASETTPTDSSKSKLTASQLISAGLSFISALTFHHDIEEQHIFPILGQRMPLFSQSNPEAYGPIQQHREIHAGLDKLQEYLMACKTGEKDFRREEVKEILDVFGHVLWKHLEQEVYELGAERMRKYWTIDEMKMLPM